MGDSDEIRERKPNQKCICKKCDDCFFYRYWPATDMAGNPIGMKQACSIEVQNVELRRLIGSIDGAQKASNETRNEVLKFGKACVETLTAMSVEIPKLLDHK